MFDNLTNLFASYIFTTSKSTEEIEERLQGKYKSKSVRRRENIQKGLDKDNEVWYNGIRK